MPILSKARRVTLLGIMHLALLGIGLLGCGSFSRSAEDVSNLPRSAAKIWIPVERAPAKVHATVPIAAAEMGLSVEVPSKDGQPWILHRGPRLEYGAIFFRVDVDPVPGQPDRSGLAVYAASGGILINDTGETISKPSELAFRIATLALGGKR